MTKKKILIRLKSYNAIKETGMVRVMSRDIFTLFGEMTTENLMEINSESMVDLFLSAGGL